MPILCKNCSTLHYTKETLIYKHGFYFCDKKCLKSYERILEDTVYSHYLNDVKRGVISFLDVPPWVRSREFKELGFSTTSKMITSNVCPVCGVIFYTDLKNPRSTCSDECLHSLNIENGKKMALVNIGWNSHGWKGGISKLPYCNKFNDDLKIRVREFFGNTCFECGKPASENGRELAIHHVNYDKQVCCNGRPPLLVPLCDVCHGKTNHNRGYWEEHFEERLKDEFNYKCYFTKEEWMSKNISYKNLEVSA